MRCQPVARFSSHDRPGSRSEFRMTDEVRQHTHAIPFVPFWIKTSDGKQHRVKHPDSVAFSPKGGSIVVFAGEETTTTLSALHIVAVESQRARSRGR